MHRIKIHGPRRDWGWIREAVVLILFFVLLGVAAFQGGYIYRDREADLPTPRLRQASDLQNRVDQLDIKTRDINGRLVGVEATIRKK